MAIWIFDEARAVLSAVLNGLEMVVRYPDTLTRVYDQAFLKSLTEREAKTLAQLHGTRDALFNLICDELGSRVGYDKTELSEEQKTVVANEAKQLLENWEQTEHSAAVLSMEENAKAAFQRLLKKHQELGESIRSIREEVIGRMRPV